MVRSAWMSGVWNSCPRSLNSVAWHLHVHARQLYRSSDLIL